VWRGVILVLCGCGRLQFDPTAGGANPGGDSDGSTGSTADAFVRGDIAFANNIAFITDDVIMLGALGSLAGADAACQSAADAEGLAGTYVAWMSTTSENAIDRLASSRGWVRADGVPFVDLPGDITAGKILSPLVVLANGTVIPTSQSRSVATGTKPSGSTGINCMDLTASTGLFDHGTASTVTADWTWYSYSWGMCDAATRLYCLGTGSTTPLAIPDVAARVAFLSTPWQPGTGLAGADAVCQADAAAAQLANASSYRALLATTSASAASRFTDGLPWKRVDGMLVADTALDLFAGNYRTPLSVFADGTYSTATGSGATVWLGAPKPDAVGTLTCQDWSVSNNGNTGQVVNTVHVDPTSGMQGCAAMNRVWCLEP